MLIQRKHMSEEHDVTITLRGMPAYLVEKLAQSGFYGVGRAAVVDEIVRRWLYESTRRGDLEKFLGASEEEARKMKYIPVDPPKGKD